MFLGPDSKGQLAIRVKVHLERESAYGLGELRMILNRQFPPLSNFGLSSQDRKF